MDTTQVVEASAPDVNVPRGRVYSFVAIAGFVAVCVSAVATIQLPTFPQMRWGGFLALALVLLVTLVVTRGRFAATLAGKLTAALAGGIVLSLTYDPQLANLGSLGAVMPMWLMDMHPSLATVGVLVMAIFGGVHALRYPHHCTACGLFVRSVLLSAFVVGFLGIALYLVFRTLYMVDSYMTFMLLGHVITYSLLLVATMRLAGAPGIGAWVHLLAALTLFAAFFRNLGEMMGAGI